MVILVSRDSRHAEDLLIRSSGLANDPCCLTSEKGIYPLQGVGEREREEERKEGLTTRFPQSSPE